MKKIALLFVVALTMFAVGCGSPAPKKPVTKPPLMNLSGRWEIEINFVAGSTTWNLYIDNNGNELKGVYRSPVVPEGTLTGHIDGDHVEMRSDGRHEGMEFHYIFTGS